MSMPHLLICRTVDGFGGHLDVFHDPMCLLTNINRSYCEEKTKSEQKTDCDWFDSISRPKGVFHLISIFYISIWQEFPLPQHRNWGNDSPTVYGDPVLGTIPL